MDEVVAEVAVDPERARVFVEGWQSWSPTTTYRLDQPMWLPVRPSIWVYCYGGSRPMPPDVGDVRFQGEGLLIVDPGDGGDVVTVGADPASTEVPTVRCRQPEPTRLVLTATGARVHTTRPAASGIPGAQASFADAFAARRAGPIRPAPTIWCSWYQYFTTVTEADMLENLEAIHRLELPVDVVQLDDGYEAGIGDWMSLSDRFSSLPGLVARIRDHGLRTGIWIAPFYLGEHSTTAAQHPEWIVRDRGGAPIVAQRNWEQDCYALDVTHPGARDYLRQVFGWFTGMGIDFFKIDFLFAAALDGVRHDPEPDSLMVYRSGLDLVRESIGPDAYLLGCGAPLLPSVGKVDAMRVSADTDPAWAPREGDMGLPGGASAELSVLARAYQHGRYWVNDPDCLLLRPGVERRERRTEVIGAYGGLRGSSDRIAALDDWGLQATRQLLSSVPDPDGPFDPLPG